MYEIKNMWNELHLDRLPSSGQYFGAEEEEIEKILEKLEALPAMHGGVSGDGWVRPRTGRTFKVFKVKALCQAGWHHGGRIWPDEIQLQPGDLIVEA